MIITIGRQHGSNGHEIARALAAETGLPCYDKEIVDHAAASSDFSKEIFDSYDEKRVSPYVISTPHYMGGMHEGFRLNMQVATAQFDAIRSLANQGSGIFVGRCADYVLRKRPDVLKVFIMADAPFRTNELMKRKNITEEQAKKLLKEVDKDRGSYYKYYTDQVWGEAENYDLCIDSSRIGIAGSVQVIKAYMEALEAYGFQK